MGKKRKLILDTETTGLNYETDKIIEIGVVELIDDTLTQNYFHEYINPSKEINLSAQKIHGISNEFLKNKPMFNTIAQKFLDFIKDDVIIIHNATFDKNFLNKELEDCGFGNLKNSIIDTITLAKKEFPGQTVNLDSLCRKLNVTNTRQDYHGALLDATLLSKVYLKLTTGKQQYFNLTNKLENSTNKDIKHKEKFLIPREKLMILSDDEKTDHDEFIKTMKNPLWKKLHNYF